MESQPAETAQLFSGWALKSADLSEGAKPSKLLVSGQVDLAGDVTAQFEPAEPYAFIS